MLEHTPSSPTSPLNVSRHDTPPPPRAGSPPLLFCMSSNKGSDVHPLTLDETVAQDDETLLANTHCSSIRSEPKSVPPVTAATSSSLGHTWEKAPAAPPPPSVSPVYPPRSITSAIATRASGVRELVQEEAVEREMLERDALARMEGVAAYYVELLEEGPDPHSRAAQLRQQYQQRLAARTQLEETREEEKMAADAEKGRQAWLEERQVQAAREAERAERAAAAKEAEILHGASRTFLIVEEKRFRAAVEEEEALDLDLLETARHESQREAERAALERFLNSPEQIELAKKAEKARRRAEAEQKRWDAAQLAFVKNCTHGRGGTSVFEGENARKVCLRCKVKWDDEAGYFVSTAAGAAAVAPPRRGSVKAPQKPPPKDAQKPPKVSPRARSAERQTTAKATKLPVIKSMKPSTAKGVRAVLK